MTPGMRAPAPEAPVARHPDPWGDARRGPLVGWGRTAPSVATLVPARSDDQLAEVVRGCGPRGVVARGLGRSYGDAAQNGGGAVLDLRGRNRIGAVGGDDVLEVEAGASLDAVMRRLLPEGYFPSVTPGTRQVTVGGAVAADVHGKNHHRNGSFGRHVRWLDLLCADGEVRRLGPGDPLFWATVGGMGLTGVVLRAGIAMVRVETAHCLVDTQRCGDLDTVMAAMADDERYEFSVAWVDALARGASLGRSVLTRGRFARRDELPPTRRADPLAFAPRRRIAAPPGLPGGLVNRLSVAAFNEAWFRRAPVRREGEVQGVAPFFHPLDGVAAWNRAYGPRGFVQYQVLVPESAGDVIRRCLEASSTHRLPSFLTVLKRMGAANPGHLSFPGPGWTLTLDVPVGDPALGRLLDRLDQLVVSVGGRSYLAKDSRMTPETFRMMYPRIEEWQQVRRASDPDGVFTSDLARRLGL
jgi:decaprenylphospho-beta-D-ribofuranose 2-oxidase